MLTLSAPKSASSKLRSSSEEPIHKLSAEEFKQTKAFICQEFLKLTAHLHSTYNLLRERFLADNREFKNGDLAQNSKGTIYQIVDARLPEDEDVFHKKSHLVITYYGRKRLPDGRFDRARTLLMGELTHYPS